MSKHRKHHIKDDITIEIGDDSAKSVRTPDITTPTSASSATSPTSVSSATGEGIGGKAAKLGKKAKEKAHKAEEQAHKAKEKAVKAKEKAKKGMMELEYQLDKIDGLTEESMSEKHAEFMKQKALEEEAERQRLLAEGDSEDKVVSAWHNLPKFNNL